MDSARLMGPGHFEMLIEGPNSLANLGPYKYGLGDLHPQRAGFLQSASSCVV